MSRAGRARRIATAAAFGGGSLGLVGAAVAGLLVSEAKLARRWVGAPDASAPVTDGIWGDGDGEPISFAVLGDSSAAGLGVGRDTQTPAVLIAAGLSELAEQPVRLVNVAVIGALSAALAAQVERLRDDPPDVALVMIGTNDVTHRIRPAVAVRNLAEAVHTLCEGGSEVVVATCPDLGAVKPIAPPLRWVIRAWSRNLAAAQTIATVEAGGRTVSLADVLGPQFRARPGELFAADRFHPSAEGYAAAAAVLLPSVAASLGLWRDADQRRRPTLRSEGVRPVARAAARAAARPGSEVTGASVDGHERGSSGRWAVLRRRGECPVPSEIHPHDSTADAVTEVD